MGKSPIEWTQKTWNPLTGCTRVSAGCDHCYAFTLHTKRHEAYQRYDGLYPRNGKPMPGQYALPFDQMQLFPERLHEPLKTRQPTMYFVNSMSDWLHKEVPDTYILQMFETMTPANHHIFQLLTKRPSRLVNTTLLQQILDRCGAWPKHIWFGVTVENNAAVWRVEKARQVPSPIRFISAEPLLEQLDDFSLNGISWLIAGAESGDGARPMHEDWVRFLRDRCCSQGTRFFYKQHVLNGKKISTPELDGRSWTEFPE